MLAAEDIVDGRYRVVRWLARGGFAEVFVVEHVQLQTRHALKVLREASAELRHRLVEEGRIQARLRHPNIVRVTDLIDLQGGGLGLIMDLVEGPSLTALLADGPVSPGEVRRLGTGILSGVRAAHKLGLVHRDLKPDNILLEQTSAGLRPRVTDFGLARARLAEASTRHTRKNLGMGTPAYMSPEQFRDAASVDERSDVFALGAILFELATGRRAFDATSPAALFRQVSTGDRPAVDALLPDLDAGMSEAIEAALEADPDLRLGSCDELLDLWTLYDEDTPQLGASAPRPERPTASPTLGSDIYGDLLDLEPAAPDLPPTAQPEVEPPPASPAMDEDEQDAGPPGPLAHPALPNDGPAGDPPPAETPQRWTLRRLATPLAALAVAALVAATRVTEPLDIYVHARLLELSHGPLPSRRTVVLTLPEVADLPALRARYPELLRQLADAGVASVSFDLGFSTTTEHDDAFAEAVEELRDRGVPVLAEGRWLDGQLQGPHSERLAAALQLGLATIETEGWQTVTLGRIPAHVYEAETASDRWALSVLTVQAWTPRLDGPRFDDRSQTLEVGGSAHPAPAGRFLLHPVEAPLVIELDDPSAWPDLGGRAVVVGAQAARDRFLTRAGLLYGAFLQAAAIETLAAGRVPSPVGLAESTATAGLSALATLLGVGLSGRRAVALVVVVLAAGWVWSRALAGEMVPVGPLGAAILLAVVATWRRGGQVLEPSASSSSVGGA